MTTREEDFAYYRSGVEPVDKSAQPMTAAEYATDEERHRRRLRELARARDTTPAELTPAELVTKAQGLMTWHVERAYREITKRADRLIVKHTRITKEEAVAGVLKTADGEALYADYQRELDLLQRCYSEAEQNYGARQSERLAKEDEQVAKAAWTADDFQAAENVRRAEREESRRQEAAYGPIRKAVEELQRADPTLSEPQAAALACEQNPSLYSNYLREIESE